MTFRDRLVAAWYAPGTTPLAALLVPLSWVFRGAVGLRRALYRRGWLASERIGAPVVVVGNITVGGSGKTPLAIALGVALAAHGRRPGFVSRGHGRRGDGVRDVQASDDATDVGDEPLLLAASGFPVVVGRDRAAAARALRAAHPDCDVVIADDGLQHYRLARDVEIAVVDQGRGVGNGHMLPAGPLREPVARLGEVDAIVRLVDEGELPIAEGGRESTMTHVPVALRSLADPSRRVDASSWSPGRVHAVAGIGNPGRFFALLARMGIDAIPHAFPDHHRYVAGDVDFPGAEAIVMTAKDAVKCARFADPRHYALDIRADIAPALVTLVLTRLDGRQAA